MKNLTLSIRKIYFNQILVGEKNSEYHAIRPNNVGRYCQLDSDREVIEIEGVIQPMKYDTFIQGHIAGNDPKWWLK